MATVILPHDVQALVEAEVLENGYADAAEYLTSLILRDQKRRAKQQLESFLLDGIDSGDYVEMTPDAWRDLRLTLHRQARDE